MQAHGLTSVRETRLAERRLSCRLLRLCLYGKVCLLGVEWLGDLREEEKNDFLGEVFAYICTYDWPGPSGLCVAEALACGTPVLAFHGGSAARVIYGHVTGFAYESLEEMVGCH